MTVLNAETHTVRSRIVAYVALSLGLLATHVLLRYSDWRSTPTAHTLLETAAAMLALITGVMALCRHYSARHNLYLLLGTGFIGAALLDAYHAVVTSWIFAGKFPSPPPSLVPWSWFASHLFLSGLLWWSWRADLMEERRGSTGLFREGTVFGWVGMWTVMTGALFAVVPMPQAIYPDWFMPRPQELIPAGLLIAACVGYVRKGGWKRHVPEHWLLLSLLAAIFGIAPSMAFSSALHDPLFGAAHVFKLLSYGCVLTGLLLSMTELFRQAAMTTEELEIQVREQTSALLRATEALETEIAEHERTEESMRQNEVRFWMVSRATNDLLWDWDLSTDGLWWGDAMRTTFGYRREELGPTSQSWSSRIHPDDHDRILSEVTDMMTHRQNAWSGEYRFRRADGSYAEVFDRAFLMFDEHGAPVRMVGAMQDCTERKRGEAAQRYLAAIVESSEDAIVGEDLNGVVTSWNRGAEKHFGYRAEEIVGRPVTALIPPDRLYEEPQIVERIRRGQPIDGMETLRVRKDGTPLEVVLTVSPIRNADGCIIGASTIMRDITERKRAEKALQESQDQLRQAQKMETVGRLAGGIAHDFNNLLTVVQGYSEMLSEDPSLDQGQRHSVDQIREACVRAVSVTSRLLAFSRKQVRQPRIINLNDLVGSMQKLLRPLIGEHLALRVSMHPAPGFVHADPGQLEQVIMNLAVNARDAMPEGGTLAIETANIVLDSALMQPYGRIPSGAYAVLAVRDTGSGMSAEVQAHLFEPFFTTKGPGKGTGLGLATVYGIVQQSNGFLAVLSEPGKGSMFQVYLPRVDAAPTTEPASASAAVASAKASGTVLLAEDEDMVRALAAHILGRQGYTVLAARDGSEALRLAQDHPGPIHLLLTDMVMPGMNGRTLAERLLLARPDTKVIVMSGYTDDPALHRNVLAGAAFVAKPFTPAFLVQKVSEVLKGLGMNEPADRRRAPAQARD